MPVIEATQRVKAFEGEYDFAIDGGGIGTINLRGVGGIGSLLPIGAVIVGGYIDVLTALTSGGAATIAGQAEAAADLFAATAVATFTLGRKNILPAPASGSVSAATYLKTTAARQLAIVIAAAALTAGKMRIVVLAR